MMKKSQILAAIALAMALGVVAPVAMNTASVFAEELTAAQTAKLTIKQVKEQFGPIVKYTPATGAYNTTLRGADAYNFYSDEYGKVTAAEKAAIDIKGKYDVAASTVTEAVADAIKGYVDTVNPTFTDTDSSTALNNVLNSDTDWKKADYDTILASTKNKILPILATAKSLASNAAAAKIQEAIDKINAEIAPAKLQETVDAKIILTGAAAQIEDLYKTLNSDKDFAVNSEANYNKAIAGVKAKMPKIARYEAVKNAIAELEAALAIPADNITIAELTKALNDANNFSATTPSGSTDKDEDTEKDPAGAPDSGILGTAEGTATTVSIVAGLATALTALGAGVVAYRSARRK